MYDTIYPFSAIVAQERLKLALILNAINSRIGGVLIRGQKGTAKSTAVRSLAALLPDIRVVQGCPYRCNPDRPQRLCNRCRDGSCGTRIDFRPIPLVTLPLNATEDMVSGGIDFSRTMKTGVRSFQPGLLAKAHRGILYVDEVNLLDDHIVDIILDAAASGQNVVEREGISFVHSSRFILVGTMNPEEGELRPQLLDRFGLCVEVEAVSDKEGRVLLMERREAYDASPSDFIRQFQEEDAKIAEQILRARRILPVVHMPGDLRTFATQLAMENNVAGHRADLVIEQAAKAAAALEGRHEVALEDVLHVAPLVFAHRKRNPAPPPHQQSRDQEPPHETDRSETQAKMDHHQQEEQQESENTGGSQSGTSGPADADPVGDEKNAEQQDSRQSTMERIFAVGETFKVRKIVTPKDRIFRRGSGRRSRTRSARKQGRYVKSTSSRNTGDIALDASLRAAAPYQTRRANPSGLAVDIRPQDIREKIREKRTGNFVLFVVDASGSMGARGRMTASKGAIMSLLLDAYQKRDKIAMISFRKHEAVVNLPPTGSVELAARLLAEMPVGGRTPLSAALVRSYEVLRNYMAREPTARPIVIIITDGRSNVALGRKKSPDEVLELAGRLSADDRIQFIVVDTESSGMIRFGLARKLALGLKAQYFKIEDLKADTLLNIAKENVR